MERGRERGREELREGHSVREGVGVKEDGYPKILRRSCAPG